MFKQLFSVFLKFPCPCCQRTTSDLMCEYCFQRLSSHQLSSSDRLKLYQAQSTFAWGRYDGQLKRAISVMKYSHQPEIGSLLGKLLAQTWLDSQLKLQLKFRSKVTVVPIPMHRKKQQERGFNQAEIIASSFCQMTGYKLNAQALIRARKTEAMFDLRNLQQRVDNLQGALQLGNKLPKYPVLLIDDIHTTGTTVKEAVKVMQQKNIQVIGVAVAAKAGLFA